LTFSNECGKIGRALWAVARGVFVKRQIAQILHRFFVYFDY
jgi:hypothetical protein